ncbi:MAG: hypothetical protein QG657_5704 [Acidobacteriota bacterium]|nr:hypothetical protein [Acidobacteriota bacterium]
MNKKPVFIHSLFRTGSTYLWNKFRQHGDYWCYYEPLNQVLAKIDTQNPFIWAFDANTSGRLKHPTIDKHHLWEYQDLLVPGQTGVPYFKKSFSFDDFCNNDANPDQKKYIDFLLAGAGAKTPLLQFNRTALRIQWFKTHYPDVIHIYLVRDPRHQFHSYLSMQQSEHLDIFLTMDLLTVSINRNSLYFKPLAERIPLYEFHSGSFEDERQVYSRLLPLYSDKEKYYIFYFTWFTALLENALHNDFILNIDLLSADPGYRRKVIERFQAMGIQGIDFADAAIGKYDSDPIPSHDIQEVEAEVRSLVTGRFNQHQIDRIESMLDPDNRDFFQVSKSELMRFKNTPVPPPPPLRSIAPTFPTATVITVTLNDAEKLEKTICSVLEQTYPLIEYIIIDGGSTDSTPGVLKKYEGRIHRVVSEPDNGIFDAMNKGIDLASGQWIIFLNAGDYFYEKNTVEKVFNTGYGDAHFIYGHTYFLGGDFRGVVKAWSFASLWKTMIFTHQSLFTRGDVLKKHKFDTSFKICADYHLIFNSYMEGLQFFNSDIVIAAFDPGFSEVSRSRMAFEKWKVVRKYRNDLTFYWFYLTLFIKRLFRDILRRFKKKVGS